MKKLNGLEYLLGFGAILVFVAGLSLIFTSDLGNSIRLLLVILLSVGMLGYSILCSKVLNVEKASKFVFVISMMLFALSYILACVNNMFGSWFSINGDGARLMFASISFLIALLSVLVAVRLKNYTFIHISLLMTLCSIYLVLLHLSLDYKLCLIIIGLILIGMTFIKSYKVVTSFGNDMLIVYALAVSLFAFEGSLLLNCGLLAVSCYGVINTLMKNKSTEGELLSLIIIGICLARFGKYLTDFSNSGLVAIILIIAVNVIDLLLVSFRLLEKNISKLLMRIINIFITLCVAIEFNSDALVAGVLALVSSYTIAYLMKNKSYEEFFLPMKISLVIAILSSFIESKFSFAVDTIYFVILNLIIMLSLYYFSKKDSSKKCNLLYSILSLVALCVLSVNMNSIFNFIAVDAMLIISFIVLVKDVDNYELNNLFITLMVLYNLFIISNNENSLYCLVTLLFFIILMIFKYTSKYCFVLLSIASVLTCNQYINTIFSNQDIIYIIQSLLLISVSLVDGAIVFKKDVNADITVTIITTLTLFRLYTLSTSLVTVLFSLIVSIILVTINIASKRYKILGYAAYVIGALDIFQLLKYIDGLSTAAYAFIIGLIILIGVSVSIYKYQSKMAKLPVCSKCGKRGEEDENFCSECGNKLR